MRPLPALTLTALLAGCSYDWAIGPSADGGLEAGAGGGHDAGPDCATLLADLDGARKAAKSCTLGATGQCSTSIVDECQCTSYVTQGGSAQAAAFAKAVQNVQAAGCTPSCSTCLESPGACLLSGGMGPYCTP